VAHKHHRKEWQTNIICFGLLASILYTWMYILGPRVYVFVYPVLCIAGIVPLLKLLALELNCLSPEMHSQIRSSFWNYYIYLITPSEVVFNPKGVDTTAVTKQRLIQGSCHLACLYLLNNFVLLVHANEFPVLIRGYLVAMQLAFCFSAVADLSLALAGLVAGPSVYLEDLFYKPYFVEAPKEFWSKRWNLVVHKYICKLLYFPLGGEKRQHLLLPLIFLSVGLLHEIPMFFLPSAKFGYWMAIFFMHMAGVFAQGAFEKLFPKLKYDPTAKLIIRILMVALLSYTSDLAFRAFGMSVEMMAEDCNQLLSYPANVISNAIEKNRAEVYCM